MASNADYARILTEGLRLETEHAQDDTWLGWSWQEVRAHVSTLSQMIIQGLINCEYASRKFTYYKTADPAKAVEFISAFTQDTAIEPEPEELIVPKDLFDFIVGHEAPKNILTLSIASPAPVHVLLIGPPATAKTLFLSELARLPGSRYALGGTSSRAGIVDFLIDIRPKYLIIDELDKMSWDDADVLLSVMETGTITRMKRNMREQIHLPLTVFAGGNNVSKVSRPLVSRFVVQHLPEYTESDFSKIAFAILTKRERVEPVLTTRIIDAIRGKTLDPRDAVKVARLTTAGGEIDDIVKSIWR